MGIQVGAYACGRCGQTSASSPPSVASLASLNGGSHPPPAAPASRANRQAVLAPSSQRPLPAHRFAQFFRSGSPVAGQHNGVPDHTFSSSLSSDSQMKIAMIALSLATCSAPAWANPVPPFALRCTADRAPAMPVSANWDGDTLTVTSPTGNLAFELKRPVSSYADRRVHSQIDGVIQLGFQERDSIFGAGTPIESLLGGNVTFHLILNSNGEVTKGALLKAGFADGILANARHIMLGECIYTLRP
ncbi:Uncharacterised protein [Achromobacter aegrifaciens]|uniref:Uncharacterized protein n=2 Tax=Alcaligenaceae TaxID=506 RepID=A0AAD2J4U2_ACHAE|nr:Uncharacterised protein [Achromobacter aegrifaciens]